MRPRTICERAREERSNFGNYTTRWTQQSKSECFVRANNSEVFQTSYHARTITLDSLLLCAKKCRPPSKNCFGGIIQVAITQEAWLRAQASVQKKTVSASEILFATPGSLLCFQQQQNFPVRQPLDRVQRYTQPHGR